MTRSGYIPTPVGAQRADGGFISTRFVSLALGERWLSEAETERALFRLFHPLSHAVACQLPPRGSHKQSASLREPSP